jgi:photosystem II stability/assembly factor-like uncharacterized protein
MKTIAILSAFLLGFGSISYAQIKVPERIRNTNQFKRAEWFTAPRAFPYDTIPVNRYNREVERELSKAKSGRIKSNEYPTWIAVGPNGVKTNSQRTVLVSGRVRAIAVHPTDPETVYIGAASGGIWKTTNGGANWTDIGYGMESLTFGAIAIDPKNPQIIYAGSGESILLSDYKVYPGKGLYKSVDGGRSWSLITNGIGNKTCFSDLVVSPHNSNLLLAALTSGYEFMDNVLPWEGIWKSQDGGITWNRTMDLQDPFDIAFHPTDPNLVYAAIGGIGAIPGFFISHDQGASWVPSNSGLILPTTAGRIQFDISQSDPNIIYSVIYDFNNDFLNVDPAKIITRAFKSVNGGNSWAHISVGTPLGGLVGTEWKDQGYYDLCIAVDPVNPNHVLIGNVEIHRTTDGSTFAPVRPFGSDFSGGLSHEDYHKLVYAPSNPNILYIGNDGGIYKSTDKGYTSDNQNKGLSTLQFFRIASHPGNPNIFIGGMQDNGTARTANGGSTWNLVTAGDGMECFFDRVNPDNILYCTYTDGKLYKSNDGGKSVYVINQVNGAFITPFFMHPTNNNILYTANKKILKSTDAGETFEVVSGTVDVSPVNIHTMAQNQVNPNIMIFGTGLYDIPQKTLIIVKVSTDEGKSWTDVTGKIPGELRWISRVVTDPVDASTLYVIRTGFSPGNKVYKSTDLGQTWTNISGDLPDLPCSDLFIDPENTSQLFVATDIGVYLSTNGGASWNYASEGMPVVPITDFDYVKIANKRYLRAGTYGRSIYETNFSRSCTLENLDFSSQAEIDNFQAVNPLCQEIKGDVIISGSDISNLNGLGSLTSIGGSLFIGYESDVNPGLTSLNGLEGISFIGGSLIIENNSLLNTLKPLESLGSIGGDLVIRNNAALNSLKGLENIDPGSIFNLIICGNSALSKCEILSICTYLLRPGGTVDIQNNGSGCNSQAEVEKACLASSGNINLENEIKIYPNPGKGLLVISVPTQINLEQVIIYNSVGKKVYQEKPFNNTVDITTLQTGMYFIEIRSDQLTARRKFIVE